MLWQLLAAAVMAVFYGTYYGKLLLQKRRGIQTDQIAKGKKGPKYATELIMKIATFGAAFTQIVCVLLNMSSSGAVVRIIGLVVGILADALFITAVVTMRDSWRAGIAENDRTTLVTGGIYSISRNPAFLAFDMFYLSILMIFFSLPLLIASVFAGVMLHLQILQEEKHLPGVFGSSYDEYRSSVRRYLGRKNV